MDAAERVHLQPGGAQALNCDRYINPQWASLMSNLEAAEGVGEGEGEGGGEEANGHAEDSTQPEEPRGEVDDAPAGVAYSLGMPSS